MTGLDKDWAVKELDAFLYASTAVSSGGVMPWPRESDAGLAERAHVVEQIVARVLTGWHGQPSPGRAKWAGLRDAAARAKAALEREEEISVHLGDGAPEMDAGQLHPWAWESGVSFWRTGHFHQAVMQAAIRVKTETQAKVGRMDVSETDLFNQAFSQEAPKPGVARLRVVPDDGSDTYRSVHRGARAFAEGLYAAIRNPGAHTLTGAVDQHECLEQLAAFSILARWVDGAILDTI